MTQDLLLHREMSARPDEFLRELGLAFPDGLYVDGDTARATVGEVTLHATWRVGAPRVIANLHLPTLHVTLRFSGASCAEQQALLAQMDRAMHRGGG